MRVFIALLSGIGIGAGGLLGTQTLLDGHIASQPYSGQDKRQISTLSSYDIRQLENGEGWGLAKPAEFNGYPGPAHVLEFADDLDLTSEQRAAIYASFKAMNTRARELGTALINAEEALDVAFKSQDVTPALLKQRLETAESIRATLRNVHLSAHLEITPLLTDKQKLEYAELRGYGYGEGHSSVSHIGH